MNVGGKGGVWGVGGEGQYVTVTSVTVALLVRPPSNSVKHGDTLELSLFQSEKEYELNEG